MRTLWRVFPWDPDAVAGEPFLAEYLPPQSGQGRFDLPSAIGASAWYLAESADHAVAEKLQDLRNRSLVDDFLFERGRRLAVCSAELDEELRLADLCDPRELTVRALGPDRLAYRQRSITQGIARNLHLDTSLAGFRWWSALIGEWHTVVLFSDRLPPGALSCSKPIALDFSTPALIDAARTLAIELVAD